MSLCPSSPPRPTTGCSVSCRRVSTPSRRLSLSSRPPQSLKKQQEVRSNSWEGNLHIMMDMIASYQLNIIEKPANIAREALAVKESDRARLIEIIINVSHRRLAAAAADKDGSCRSTRKHSSLTVLARKKQRRPNAVMLHSAFFRSKNRTTCLLRKWPTRIFRMFMIT